MNENVTEKHIFMLIYRYIQINYERCNALDLVDLMSAMQFLDGEFPIDAGTVADLRQAIDDLESGRIDMNFVVKKAD